MKLKAKKPHRYFVFGAVRVGRLIYYFHPNKKTGTAVKVELSSIRNGIYEVYKSVGIISARDRICIATHENNELTTNQNQQKR